MKDLIVVFLPHPSPLSLVRRGDGGKVVKIWDNGKRMYKKGTPPTSLLKRGCVIIEKMEVAAGFSLRNLIIDAT